MAIYYTLGTQDGTPIDGAPKWSGRDYSQAGFMDTTAAAAARHVSDDAGDVYLVKVEGRLASGRIKR